MNNCPNETELQLAEMGFKGFCNPCWMPSVEWINGEPFYPAYKARSCINERLKKLEVENAMLREQIKSWEVK